MATVAEFMLSADEFPLGTIFAKLPDVTVQLERVIPDANGVVPYFWVRGVETDAIVEQFSEHPGVRDIRTVDQVNREYLMRCEWVPEYDSVLDALIAPEIVLLTAIGTAEEWTFELRGEKREAIAEFREYCHDHGVPVRLTELHALRPLDEMQGLTDGQREAMILAYDRGYYNSPRDTTLAEIADDLGISQQALGARLRRGNRRLIEQALIESHS
ncbi:helix-turn-helix domain-containing protein [Halorarum halophilum]|uniref:Helix-turn-helix domain-containing protein n=1 Tax=Halorarum halophilum TaxID=2743090 RepID=A0A7D5GHB9_9EURY|nr:helix-turn-helix domain-containing protein [Halobaculum halophilum]QLG27411.1 helix-turn-helix domain-containing protein [Halobaculum halophilum]